MNPNAHLTLAPYMTTEDSIKFVCQLCEDKTVLEHAEVREHFNTNHPDLEGTIMVDDTDPGYHPDANPNQDIIDAVNNPPSDE